MDDLSALLGGAQDKGNDLIDKLTVLLDRQTDHKLTPSMLFGFMGMYNLMSIINVVKGNSDAGIREITGGAEGTEAKPAEQSLVDGLSSLLKGQVGGQGGGQPDLMGLLANVASKKKINPNVLLSLFSMLNNQAAQNNVPGSVQASPPAEKAAPNNTPEVSPTEKKNPEEKQEMELKYDRKKGVFDRS